MAGSGYVVATPGGGGGHGGGGAFGLVTNLVKDIGNAARGLPEGIVQTAEHPIRTAENVGKSTWQTWSPLFHGDLGQFGHQFYDHPLAPLLDIGTVFTGGASVAAKLGIKAADAGLISGDSALAQLGKMPTKLDITGQQAGRDVTSITRTKYLPKNPIYNKVYRSAMAAADKHGSIPGWFLKPMSSAHVYGRLEKVDWAHSGLALRAQIAAMMKAGEVFNKAGHSDWKNLEDQLYSRNYGSLVQHSETMPVAHIPAPEASGTLKAAIQQRDRFAERLQKAHANEQQFLVDRRAKIAANSKVGGKGFLLDNPHRETIVTLGHQLDAATKKVERLQKAHETSYAGLHPHFGGADAPGLPHGYTYVAKVDPTKLFDKHATNVNEFASHVGSLSDHFTTPDIRKALITADEHGNPVVHLAHQRALEATMLDAKHGAHFLAKLARYPTTVWKAVTLGLSPRVVVNNGIGNWLMYAMRQGGAHSAQGFVDAVRFTRGERAAMKMLKETGTLPKEHFLNQHFRDELGNTFGSAQLGSSAGVQEHVGAGLGNDAKGGNVLDKAVGAIYKHGFYSGVHRYSDVPVRAAAISAYLRGDPMVKGLMKAGKSFEDAASTALKSNKELRDRAALHARSVAGDYTTMSGFEQAVRDFVPFYLWDKHIAKHAINMLRDRPGVVTADAAVGQEGANATRKQLGNIPDWMVGGIPLKLHIPGEGGRQTLLNTQGMNPYSTLPDLASFAQALTTGHTADSAGDTILGTVNPTIKGLVEHTMGQKATGAPITSHGGVIPSTLVDIFNSLRPVALARTAAGATPQTKNPRLYKTDINTILSSLAGVPIQEADMGRAAQLAAQIANGGKKPKKGRSGYVVAP